MTQAVLASLYALRAQVDALIVQVEGAIPPDACAHEETIDAGSTLGGNTRRKCVRCGAIV